MGFHFDRNINMEISRTRNFVAVGNVFWIGAPLWPLLALLAILPIIRRSYQMYLRRLMKQGHCPVCAYDLRATPERCPECGAVSAKVAGISN